MTLPLLRRSLMLSLYIAGIGIGLFAPGAYAELILCGPELPSKHQINIHVVQTFLDNGTDPSSVGTPRIYELVDQIYSQLGIDVAFSSSMPWNNTFAHQGINGVATRNASDFGTILSSARTAGKTAPSDTTINMFFVDVVPSFPALSNTNAAGFSAVDSNGIAIFVGSNVGMFPTAEETAATIIAHAIGHNLGLVHSNDPNNLMTAIVSGQCITAAQSEIVWANRRGFLRPLLACDLNGDGAADAADAGIMFGNWGESGLGDCNNDGIVDAADAGLLFSEWTADEFPAAVPEPSVALLPALLVASMAIRTIQHGRRMPAVPAQQATT